MIVRGVLDFKAVSGGGEEGTDCGVFKGLTTALFFCFWFCCSSSDEEDDSNPESVLEESSKQDTDVEFLEEDGELVTSEGSAAEAMTEELDTSDLKSPLLLTRTTAEEGNIGEVDDDVSSS